MAGPARQRLGFGTSCRHREGPQWSGGERQREGAIWCLEVEGSGCLVSGKWGVGGMHREEGQRTAAALIPPTVRLTTLFSRQQIWTMMLFIQAFLQPGAGSKLPVGTR